MHGWSEGRLIARHEWAPGLATLSVEAEIEPFVPGQFVNLALEHGDAIERRSYSIASPPGAPLEFLVAEVPHGKLTPDLMGLAPGARVLVEPKPQGFFTLRWVPEARDLWLLATGTGLGPFLSILRDAEVWQRFERVVLVHGARDVRHLAHAADLRALAARQPKLGLVSIVSREPEASGVLHGRVTTAFADGSLEAEAGLAITPEHSHLMLCGNPAMIDEMLEKLAARGLRKHRVRVPGHVTLERYW